MKASFTPEPWEYAQYTDGDNAIIGPNGDERICEMITNVSDEERDANARLIKAAPKLLDSQEDLIAIVDNLLLAHRDSMSKEDYAGRRETLKKAVEINSAAGGLYDWDNFEEQTPTSPKGQMRRKAQER